MLNYIARIVKDKKILLVIDCHSTTDMIEAEKYAVSIGAKVEFENLDEPVK